MRLVKPCSVLAVAVLFAEGCSEGTTTPLVEEGALDPPVLQLCSDNREAAIATFEDANLEAVVRSALGVGAQADLTCGLLAGLTDLNLRARNAGITSLVGIQNLTGLSFVRLDNNSISDISPLSGLTSLGSLTLHNNSITDISPLSGFTSLRLLSLNNNSITDISPLSGLTSLTELHLDNNSITDISPLSGLTSLQVLSLANNSISDLSPLSGLTSLAILILANNSISDISALSGLTSLQFLDLDNNPDLSNIQPLLDNTGLGSRSDQVLLRSTSVSCTDVAALEAKGVTVFSDCP